MQGIFTMAGVDDINFTLVPARVMIPVEWHIRSINLNFIQLLRKSHKRLARQYVVVSI